MVHVGGKKTSVKAKICGSTVAGISEIFLFHPIDTVAKRLMNNTNPLRSLKDVRATVLGNQSVTKLYSGIQAGFAYKVSQRTYKVRSLEEFSPRTKGVSRRRSLSFRN